MRGCQEYPRIRAMQVTRVSNALATQKKGGTHDGRRLEKSDAKQRIRF
jgi:hypothetical protein